MPQWLINPLLQTELIHFLAGPSGAGKTRWLLCTLYNQWRLGKDVLGHTSYPVPWCYVPMDRPYISVETTLLDLGIDPLNINVICAMDAGLKSITQVLDNAESSRAKLIVIEMFSYLLRGKQDGEAVRDFMGAVQTMLAGTGMTILGTMECPKMRPKDTYRNPRQRISGPASWGHCAETIFLIENDPKACETSPKRIIRVLPRNSAEEVYTARFYKNGRLYLDKKSEPDGEGNGEGKGEGEGKGALLFEGNE